MHDQEEIDCTQLPSFPKKLSNALLIALDSLNECEQHPNYEIDMGRWHELDYQAHTNICLVCLAGSLIAKCLQFPFESTIFPAHFKPELCKKLKALDYLRTGKIYKACVWWLWYEKWNDKAEIATLDKKYLDQVIDYHHSPKKFKIKLREIARDLQKIGL